MGNLKITFLGTGTSQGVPLIGCHCEVCSSQDPKDKRLRSSCLIESDKGTILTIDAGPDFRQQMLKNNVDRLDAILVSHAHRDHISGLDDVRSYNYLQSEAMPIYSNKITLKEIKKLFAYAFSDTKYPGLPTFNLVNIDKKKKFNVKELEVIPIEIMHYRLPIMGYRIDNFAYITDGKTISDQEKEKLKGVEFLVLNALRKEEHFSHFTLNEALDLIKEINPKQSYLTHISHNLGLTEDLKKELPSNVSLAYDGLTIII
ncbi:MAG: MBL fold metallo-hydrolase [Bacteroidales bacterium]|jgi:phosphoribosyl 1,2-cyclic phosphate phosphodiesterase|nr:MBL fold metallo-hydrolase [Bacteroidales bacterium]MDD4702707.1 MBL fold metallo-hydrolase [Bacteroidales bacterium]MDX9797259.1 MBL fold metallo-hydrolase [Bacteroidales bacterium]